MRSVRAPLVATPIVAAALLFAGVAVAQEQDENEADPLQEEGSQDDLGPAGADATIELSHQVASPGDAIEVKVTGCGPGIDYPPGGPDGPLLPGGASITISPPAEILAEGQLVEEDGSFTEVVQIPLDVLTWMDPEERFEVYGFEPGEFEVLVHCMRDADLQSIDLAAPILIVEPEPRDEPERQVVEPSEATPQFTG